MSNFDGPRFPPMPSWRYPSLAAACPHVGGTHAGGVGGVVVGLALRFTFSSHGPDNDRSLACGGRRVPAEDGPAMPDALLCGLAAISVSIEILVAVRTSEMGTLLQGARRSRR